MFYIEKRNTFYSRGGEPVARQREADLGEQNWFGCIGHGASGRDATKIWNPNSATAPDMDGLQPPSAPDSKSIIIIYYFYLAHLAELPQPLWGKW